MQTILIFVAGAIYLLLGTGHGILTLADVARPRTFTPVDDNVRIVMQRAPIRLNPHTDLWRAWLGFNLSHSMGVMLFGTILIAIAWMGGAAYLDHLAWQIGTILFSLAYVIVAQAFWFWIPALGSGVATVCLLVASLS